MLKDLSLPLGPVPGMLAINLTMYYIFPFYKITIITQTIIALPQNQLIFVYQTMNSQRILEKVRKSHQPNITNNDSKGVERRQL